MAYFFLILMLIKRGKMRIKKFRAKTIQEGKEEVFSELGQEAIILSSRVIPPSPPDMEEMIELVAAVASDTPTEYKFQPKKYISTDDSLSKSDVINITSQIFKEISSLKTLFWNLSDKITYNYVSKFESDLQKLGKLMSKNGFTTDFVLSTLNELSPNKYGDFDKLRTFVLRNLSNKINYSVSFEKSEQTQKIIFIGPTGSGKTLTLVKISVLLKLVLNSKVAVISADTQKVGGWEQLQIICAVTNLPCSFVQSKEELVNAFNEFRRYDFVMIDTSGVSPRDETFLEEINELTSFPDVTDVVLVLPVTISNQVFNESLFVFKKLNPTKIVLTKFDEVTTIGHIYEVLVKESRNIPLIYCTNGINIPHAIEPAEPDFISKYLINYLD